MLQLVSSLLENDPDLIKDFFLITEQDISQLDHLLKTSDDKNRKRLDINEIFRLVNLIRMNSETLNLPSISNKAQLFENIVNRIKRVGLKSQNDVQTLIDNNQFLKKECKDLNHLLNLIYNSLVEFHTRIKNG